MWLYRNVVVYNRCAAIWHLGCRVVFRVLSVTSHNITLNGNKAFFTLQGHWVNLCSRCAPQNLYGDDDTAVLKFSLQLLALVTA